MLSECAPNNRRLQTQTREPESNDILETRCGGRVLYDKILVFGARRSTVLKSQIAIGILFAAIKC